MNSKYDNRSTSSSEYFKQRFTSQVSQIKQQSNYKPQFRIQSQYENQIQNDYNIPQSKAPGIHTYWNNQQIIIPKQNPFLSKDYDNKIKYKKDKISENKYQNQEYRKNHPFPLSQRKKIFQSKSNHKNYQTGTQLSESRQSCKQNLSRSGSAKKLFISSSPKNFFTNQNNKLENSNPTESVYLYNHEQGTEICASEIQGMLQRLHKTIKNQSNIIAHFKHQISEKKSRIRLQFSFLLKELQNYLQDVQNGLIFRLDQQFKWTITNFTELKQNVHMVFKQRIQARMDHELNLKMQGKYQNLQNAQIQRIKRQKSLYQAGQNISSKSQGQFFTNHYGNDNIALLRELKNQDNKMNIYSDLTNFYSNEKVKVRIRRQVQRMHEIEQKCGNLGFLDDKLEFMIKETKISIERLKKLIETQNV